MLKSKYIDVNNGDWGIVVNYDYDITDFDELASIMDAFGMLGININKALNILAGYNTGMSVSRNDLRMSAVFISKATSSSQFLDTLNHELYHCCVAIIDYYGEQYDKEPAAYLQGYLMRKAVEKIGEPCY